MRNRISELWKRFAAFTSKIFHGAGTGLRNLYQKTKAFFKKRRRQARLKGFQRQMLSADFTPELESVVSGLIDDTIGAGGSLEWEFQRQIDYYKRMNQPIGEPQARMILLNLLKVAVSERERLNGRLERCVEVGDLYSRYYSKLQTVYDLDVKTENARLEMELAKHECEFIKNVYLNAQKAVYGKEYVRKYQEGADVL